MVGEEEIVVHQRRTMGYFDKDILSQSVHTVRIRVPVKDGDYATCYVANTYFDDEGHRGADTERLIREVKDEDKLRSISGYITGIDWKGTPYDYDLLLKGTDEK